jgi:hypothetical protein
LVLVHIRYHGPLFTAQASRQAANSKKSAMKWRTSV